MAVPKLNHSSDLNHMLLPWFIHILYVLKAVKGTFQPQNQLDTFCWSGHNLIPTSDSIYTPHLSLTESSPSQKASTEDLESYLIPQPRPFLFEELRQSVLVPQPSAMAAQDNCFPLLTWSPPQNSYPAHAHSSVPLSYLPEKHSESRQSSESHLANHIQPQKAPEPTMAFHAGIEPPLQNSNQKLSHINVLSAEESSPFILEVDENFFKKSLRVRESQNLFSYNLDFLYAKVFILAHMPLRFNKSNRCLAPENTEASQNLEKQVNLRKKYTELCHRCFAELPQNYNGGRFPHQVYPGLIQRAENLFVVLGLLNDKVLHVFSTDEEIETKRPEEDKFLTYFEKWFTSLIKHGPAIMWPKSFHDQGCMATLLEYLQPRIGRVAIPVRHHARNKHPESQIFVLESGILAAQVSVELLQAYYKNQNTEKFQSLFPNELDFLHFLTKIWLHRYRGEPLALRKNIKQWLTKSPLLPWDQLGAYAYASKLRNTFLKHSEYSHQTGQVSYFKKSMLENLSLFENAQEKPKKEYKRKKS
ncbi:hypothetical protein O181_018674 [Austropuccinia psidii MF-1]|uniref:Uncharacterized protein n=1 Tax=Austropuccinia psidii MF-1 TaxID=1389203 RepID=A0A9Q3GTZ8_9BASI|nr:hypothetical protein [Austropuccinia psidii MF-1]